MDERLESILVQRYPILFKDYKGDPRKTCMAWGMSCGDGWFTLIDELCRQLSIIAVKTGTQVIAHQVKEKFGGLRFYYGVETELTTFERINWKFRELMCSRKWGRGYNKINDFRKKFYKTVGEKIQDLISEAEMKTYKTCETCGQPGERRGGSWVNTSCDECDKKFDEGKRQWKHPEEFPSVYDMMFGKDYGPVV